ncbi:MAG: hypothetical protein DME21_17060 [Verrucomicrobia bacterium]|nr:MAG: hypothetical protein DME21_17060 [Verrucomicrobiota bacterium]
MCSRAFATFDTAKPRSFQTGRRIFSFRPGGVIRVETVDIVILIFIVAVAALILFGASWHDYD